jgi:tetratricopeptide (TPR) repeat protein
MLSTVLDENGDADEAVAVARLAVDRLPAAADAHCNLGIALGKNRQFDEAIAAYNSAIEIDPTYAQAYCNLGLTLWNTGDFTSAAAALQRGHELGSRFSDWPYDSARWLKECRRLVKLETQLQAVLEGRARPANSTGWNQYAQICFYKKKYLDSARFRLEAFRNDSQLADDWKAGHRYDAACAAALAAADADDGALCKDECVRWRLQALDWLRANLEVAADVLDDGEPADRAQVRMQLQHWQCDPDLASLRDSAAVAKLTPQEQRLCTKLWADLVALLKSHNAK